MRRVLVCTGVLGGGTALVFALAALTATLFPHGTMVASGWNGPMRAFDIAPMPIEAPAMGGGVMVAPNLGGGVLRMQVDTSGNQLLDANGNPAPVVFGVTALMRALFVAGVLGLGTALVFGAAALTATLFPNGTMVSGGWNGGWNGAWGGKGMAVPMPAPMVLPADGTVTITNDVGTGIPVPTDLPLAPDVPPAPDRPMPTD